MISPKCIQLLPLPQTGRSVYEHLDLWSVFPRPRHRRTAVCYQDQMKQRTLEVLEPRPRQGRVIITTAFQQMMRRVKISFPSFLPASALCVLSQRGVAADRPSGETTDLRVCWAFLSPRFLAHETELRITA